MIGEAMLCTCLMVQQARQAAVLCRSRNGTIRSFAAFLRWIRCGCSTVDSINRSRLESGVAHKLLPNLSVIIFNSLHVTRRCVCWSSHSAPSLISRTSPVRYGALVQRKACVFPTQNLSLAPQPNTNPLRHSVTFSDSASTNILAVPAFCKKRRFGIGLVNRANPDVSGQLVVMYYPACSDRFDFNKSVSGSLCCTLLLNVNLYSVCNLVTHNASLGLAAVTTES